MFYLKSNKSINVYEEAGCTYPFTSICPKCRHKTMNGEHCTNCNWKDPCIWDVCKFCGAYNRHIPGKKCNLCGK